MRYGEKEFEKSVQYYKKVLTKAKVKNIFIYGDFNKDAFFSIAPFSRAASDLKIDMRVSFGYKSHSYEVLFDIWKTYQDLKSKKDTNASLALKDLLSEIKIKQLNKFFEKAELVIKVEKNNFSDKLKYQTKWFRPFMAKKLKHTSDAIIKHVYNLKKNEAFSIGFVLVPDRKFLSHPLQDYLDAYAVCYNVFISAKNNCKSVSVKASTAKASQRAVPEKVSELMTTLIGLELEKEINLPIFRKYKKLSRLLKLDRLKVPPATFFVSGKGYHGKHIFGEKIGYPTKNKKSKWTSPGGMIYKFHWYPQSYDEDRPPKSRVAFTSTVPIDKLIESTLVDYEKMRKRNADIAKIMDKCETIFVKSNIEDGCDFEVGLIKKDGTRRLVLGSDSDVRTILHPLMLKQSKKMGRMANIPGGEAFTTPSYVKGTIVGDVVINIDRSWNLDGKTPFIAEATKTGYKVISGPKKVISAFNKRKKEAWKNILEQEKNKSLPKKLIELKKKNFEHIGEFAINTNPHASLCDYLIINEKIANMIHVAFGSGFEPDTATEYHMDVVINSPRQKLDIYGIDKKNKTHWIIKRGKFVS